MRKNATEEIFEGYLILKTQISGGIFCLFDDIRIDRSTIPEEWQMFEVRHSDEDWGEPVEFGDGIMVNFYGTILIRKEDVPKLGGLWKQWLPNGNRYITIEGEDDFEPVNGAYEYYDGDFDVLQ